MIEEIQQDIRDLRDSWTHMCAADSEGEGKCSCGEYDAIIDKLDDFRKAILIIEFRKLQ